MKQAERLAEIQANIATLLERTKEMPEMFTKINENKNRIIRLESNFRFFKYVFGILTTGWIAAAGIFWKTLLDLISK